MAGAAVARARRSTSQASADMTTPIPMSTGTKTLVRPLAGDSHSKWSRAGGADSRMRASTRASGGVAVELAVDVVAQAADAVEDGHCQHGHLGGHEEHARR